MKTFKNIFLLVVILSVNLTIKAQDTIFLHNGEKIISEIIEVNQKEVKYKDFTKSNSIIKTLTTDAIFSLHFNDGSIIKNPKELLGKDTKKDTEVAYINDVPVPNKREANSYRNNQGYFKEEDGYQVKLGQTYRTNRKFYNPRFYSPQYGDPYNPGIAGIVSFLVPGGGQMISGEIGRGLGFLGAYAGSMLLTVTGAFMTTEEQYRHNSHFYYRDDDLSLSLRTNGNIGSTIAIVGLLSMISVHIWSIVDAVKVAKVNNMYYQDLRQNYVSMELKPYVSKPNPFAPTKNQAVGLSLAISF